MPFEASTIATATLGSFVGGSFSDTFVAGSADVDMIALDLTEGQFYEIDIDNGTAGDFYLRIFDQFGVEVRAVDDGNYSSDNTVFSLSPYLRFTPNYTGLYYVAVSPWYLDSYDPNTLNGRAGGENPLAFTSGTLIVTEIGSSGWGGGGSINAITFESSNDLTDMLRDTDGSMRVELAGSIDSLTDLDMMRLDVAKGDVVVVDVNGALTGGTIGTLLRVFDDNGVQIGIDDDSGFGEDPELVFNVPLFDDYYIAITGEGNGTYNALDGTGTVNGAATGDFEVIIHRNPTQIGSGIANSFIGDATANYIVSLGGNDTVTGNDGRDTLAGGDDQDSVNGGDGNDVIYGEHGNDILRGDRDSDVVSGGLGGDVVDGGSGNDVLYGGVGNDGLFGGIGSGRDTLHGDDGDDLLEGDGGNDTLFGGNGVDTLRGEEGKEALFGDAGNDALSGGAGADTLDGGLDNDTLLGDAGFDVLFGNAGLDMLDGGAGSDTLNGGAGDDVLTGGTNTDSFVFTTLANGVDTITDFDVASLLEVIDLSAIFAATGSVVTAINLSQFVQCTPAGAGADSFLGVDADGLTGGLSFTIIAQVNLVTPAQLFDFGNFIV